VSGVAKIFGARGQESQWLPLTEFTNLKKNQNYFLNFPLLVSITLNLLRAKNIIFFFSVIHFAAPWNVLSKAAAALSTLQLRL